MYIFPENSIVDITGKRSRIRSGRFMAGGGFRAAVPACFELKAEIDGASADSGGAFELRLRESAALAYADGILSLDLTGCGAGRTVRSVPLPGVHSLWILSDTSSLEIFVNGGEEVFTTRIYDSMEGLPLKLFGLRILSFCSILISFFIF